MDGKSSKSQAQFSISREEGDALIERLEAGELKPQDYAILKALVGAYFWLTNLIREKSISLSRLKKMIFGVSGRKSPDKKDASSAANTQSNSSATDPSNETETTPDHQPASTLDSVVSNETEEILPTADSSAEDEKSKKKGHGRLGANDYPEATTLFCRHQQLKTGDLCPAYAQPVVTQNNITYVNWSKLKSMDKRL